MPLQLLLVEDNTVDRVAAHRALAKLHPDIIDANSLAEGRAILKNRKVDCMILDWRLPDGLADNLLTWVRRDHPQLPVVILTGADEATLAKQVLQKGAQDYLQKDEMGAHDLVRSVLFAVERQRATELATRLAHADRLSSVGRLAAGVAHEVNNPAMVLSGNLEVLRSLCGSKPVDPGQLLELIEECELATKKIAVLMSQLSGFSRRSLENIERVDFRQLVDDAIRLARPSMRHHAHLTTHLPEVAPIVVDRQAVSGVIVNLLVNAQQAIDRASPDDPAIRVTLTATAGALQLEVEDSGPGVRPGDDRAIFEPFFSTSKNGSGLGLAISKDIVEVHGGRIEVGPSALGGATFRLILPSDTGLRPDAVTPTTETPTGLAVLVIDDDPFVRSSIRRLLEDHHRVHEAASSADGLAVVAAERAAIDVILCDLMLDEESGAEFLTELHQRAPTLVPRVVFITGGAVTTAAREFLARTTHPTLLKPFTKATLQTAMAEVVAAAG